MLIKRAREIRALEGLRTVVGTGARQLERAFGGAERTRVIVVLSCVLALSSADISTVGASASQLRRSLDINNTDIGLLVAVTLAVAAVASIPFGALADRVRRTWALGGCVALWGAGMIWSAAATSFHELLITRLFLGGATAAAGPFVASLVGDYFAGAERGRIYGYILTGELLGVGVGFSVTGDIASLSWRAAFVFLALPALVLAWMVATLPEPERGGRTPLVSEQIGTEDGAPDSQPNGGTGGTGTDETIGALNAQRLAMEKHVLPNRRAILREDPRRMNLLAAATYVLRVRTNVVLILSSACAYYFMAGVETFGIEFVTQQYGIVEALANLLLLVVGAGTIGGVLAGGALGDRLLAKRHLNGRIAVSAVSAAAAVVLFIPALLTHSVLTALPYVIAAGFALSAQNPPLDAARLDIMPPLLWGRAEGIRTFLRTTAQALAPLVFGFLSDSVFGGGRAGLQWTFIAMLAPLALSSALLFRAMRTYPSDVAAAAVSGAGSTESAPQRIPLF